MAAQVLMEAAAGAQGDGLEGGADGSALATWQAAMQHAHTAMQLRPQVWCGMVWCGAVRCTVGGRGHGAVWRGAPRS